MLSDQTLDSMTVAATRLGWSAPVPAERWPQQFDRGGSTWILDHLTVAQKTGEVQCGEYTCGADWLIVYND